MWSTCFVPPILIPIQTAITLLPPIPVNRHHWLRSLKSSFGKPGKDVDTKARLRHGSVMLVYPLQEPDQNKTELNEYFYSFSSSFIVLYDSCAIPLGKPQVRGRTAKPGKRQNHRSCQNIS